MRFSPSSQSQGQSYKWLFSSFLQAENIPCTFCSDPGLSLFWGGGGGYVLTPPPENICHKATLCLLDFSIKLLH